MRAFIALALPPRFADEVAALSRRLAHQVKGRFMPRENHHVTLAFLGDLCEAETTLAIGALERACDGCAPATLCPDGLGTFARAHDATLWLGLAPDPGLCALAERVRSELDAAGIPYDAKPFRPHVTLARRARLAHGALPNLPFPNRDAADEAVLFKSILDGQGATYKPLYRVALAGDGAAAAQQARAVQPARPACLRPPRAPLRALGLRAPLVARREQAPP